MATIADVKAQIEAKQKLLQKNETEEKKLREEFRKIATDQQKAEQGAKAAKDKRTKEALHKQANDLRAKGEGLLKKIEVVSQAGPKLEASIKELGKQLKALEEGVAKFGKARQDYLTWFKGEEVKLKGLLKEIRAQVEAARKAFEETDDAIDIGGNASLAKTLAAKAAEAAGKAKQLFGKIESLIQSWGPAWTKQRNLAPKKDFGVETADVAVHAALTSQVYATFKVGDDARDEAQAHMDDAVRAAEDAKDLAEAGQKNAAVFAGILVKAKASLTKLTSEYDGIWTHHWGKAIADGGQPFIKRLAELKANRTAMLPVALKTVEQARETLPKVMSSAKALATRIHHTVDDDIGKVPEVFHRALKPAIDELRMGAMRILRDQSGYEIKLGKAEIELGKLEAATKKV